MKKEYDCVEIIRYRQYMNKNNIDSYTKRSLIRSILGIGCIVVGLVTTFIPCTTIPLLLLGGSLMGYDMKALIKKLKYESHLIKLRLFR